jgi:2-oxoisovalerate dehydrogenase E1 component
MDALTRRDSNADIDQEPLSRDAWLRVLECVLLSRQLDAFEEQLVPRREVYYQFSARGHEVSQCLLGEFLDHPADGLAVYYRSRPLMLSLGLEPEAALAATMMRAGSMSEGRDIGVVFNRPGAHGQTTVLPACGGVGAQYTPAVGWAQALLYRQRALGESGAAGAIAVVHGGDGSTATNGFWSALNIATTRQLPLLFFIEDNGFGISVPSSLQTPGGDICENLSGFGNLAIFEADAAAPAHAAAVIARRCATCARAAAPRCCACACRGSTATRTRTTRPTRVPRSWSSSARAIHCWRCGACWYRPC